MLTLPKCIHIVLRLYKAIKYANLLEESWLMTALPAGGIGESHR